jgi:hypothetical protein
VATTVWIGSAPVSDLILTDCSCFDLTEAGILITFPPYAVASYADGARYVTIPWSAVREIISPLIRL